LKSTIPGFVPPHKTAVLLTLTVLFFATGLLDINDLEEIPWNIILLFAGAMSIGFCLWQTGAAEWMAVNWLTMFKESTGSFSS
jgi:sodium-dependent dicarboxylate transporter 2/3/5